jgi:hypothetical protein
MHLRWTALIYHPNMQSETICDCTAPPHNSFQLISAGVFGRRSDARRGEPGCDHAVVFYSRGNAWSAKGDYDRGIAEAARHDGLGNVQAGTKRCSQPNQKIAPKRRTPCSQTRYP